jgi:putative Mg2+ transporter-C (MgtC) family protein
MLPFQQMLIRFAVALALGAILGVERELVKKEAGVRTEMLVSGGAAIFAMIGLTLPYLTASAIGTLPDATTINAGLAIIANIVVGIGFLGAGLIVKMKDHPHGVTTAALVWTTAAIGTLAGIGLMSFATVAALLIVLFLFVFRKLNISEKLENELPEPAPRHKKKG